MKGFRVLSKKRMILDTIYISLLSKNKDIKNPYFGEQMLGCGETIDRLPYKN